MSPDRLREYFRTLEQGLSSLQSVHFERYEEEFLTPTRANLRIRMRTLDGYLFEINEAVIVHESQLEHLNYRYHFQDSDNQLIFRYDNTPHYPHLEHFPEHKHTSDGIVGAKRPGIRELLKEIRRYYVPDR